MILLTGATGFLGAHVCASLVKKGYAVRALKRKNSRLNEFENIMNWRLGRGWQENFAPVEWVEGDILDYESLVLALVDIEAVFHVAAVVSFWKPRRDELYRINVEGTATVVNAALAAGVPWIIHTSSVAAIGRDDKNPEITEANEWTKSHLNSHYANSKHLAEMEGWRGREEGLKAAMVNPTVIFGEGDWENGSCRFMKKIMDGMPYYTGGANGYVDVIDVAESMVLVYEKQLDGQRIILVGENLSAKELISIGGSVFGHAAPRFEIKPWMIQIAYRLLGLASIISKKEPLITKETATTALHCYQYNAQKAQDLLGVNFTPIRNTFLRVKGLMNK
jgi:dihydroflavonol-4-reductase